MPINTKTLDKTRNDSKSKILHFRCRSMIEKQCIKWNANKLIVLATGKYARDISEPHKIMHSIKCEHIRLGVGKMMRSNRI